MRTALIILLFVSAPLALPTVSAQEPDCTFTISPPAAPAPIAPGDSADLVVEAQTTTSGRPVTVTVEALTTASGWTLSGAPAAVDVTTDQPGQFTFTITPSESASETALVSFSASGTCDPPGPLPNPLAGQCPPATCVADNVNQQVTVSRAAAPGGFPFLENLNVPLEYLIAGVVLIGLASAIPFLMRRSKGGIVAQCPEPLKMVKPGRGTSFPIELRNGTKETATAQFEVGPVPEGWSAFMPLPEVQLAAREARSLWLMVRSPATAGNGDAVDVELRLRDPRGKDGGLVKVRAEVQGAGEA